MLWKYCSLVYKQQVPSLRSPVTYRLHFNVTICKVFSMDCRIFSMSVSKFRIEKKVDFPNLNIIHFLSFDSQTYAVGATICENKGIVWKIPEMGIDHTRRIQRDSATHHLYGRSDFLLPSRWICRHEESVHAIEYEVYDGWHTSSHTKYDCN